jgi:uncharacterized protein (UPF0262 family)
MMVAMTQTDLKSVQLASTDRSPLNNEKDMALKALSEDSVFRPAGQSHAGPYDLTLSIHDGRLIMDVRDNAGVALPSLILSIKPYSRLVRDYFMMIESYEIMRREGTAAQLEAVDMGRRGLHNEGGTLLIGRLQGKIELDLETARRLFTLICILHKQHFPVF